MAKKPAKKPATKKPAAKKKPASRRAKTKRGAANPTGTKKAPAPGSAKKVKAPPRVVGRPKTMTPAKCDHVIELICEGYSVAEIARFSDMPARSTIMLKIANDEEFSDRYARAKRASAECEFDEIKKLADDGSGDWVQPLDDDGNPEGEPFYQRASIERTRMQLEARKWRLSKLVPKIYGAAAGIVGGDDPDDDAPKNVTQIILTGPDG